MAQVPAPSVSETIQRFKNSEEFVEELIKKKLEKKKGAKKEEEKGKKEKEKGKEEEPMRRKARRRRKRKEEEEPMAEEQMLCAESEHSVVVAALEGEGRMNLIGEVKMFKDEVEVKEEKEEEDKEEEGYKDYEKYETLRRAKKEEEKEKKEEPMLRKGWRRRKRMEEEDPMAEEMYCAESVHSVVLAAPAGEGRMNLIGQVLTEVKMFEDEEEVEMEMEMEVKEEEQEEDKEEEEEDEVEEEEEGYKDYGKYETLRRAAVDEDWHVVKKFIKDHPKALKEELLDTFETILHYVVKSKNTIEFVQELVSEMPEEALELTDMREMTALSYCAAYGNIEAAKIMVQKNHRLLYIPDRLGNLPLHYAAKFGKEDMVHFLLLVTKDQSFLTAESGVKLVENLITANLYGIAFELLERDPKLAREGIPDDFSLSDVGGGDEENPKKSSKDCFTKCREFGFLQRTSSTSGAMCKKVHIMLYNTIKRLVPSIESIHDTKLMHKHTSELVKLICKGVTLNFKEAKDLLKMPILTAARSGIQEIVYEIMKTYFSSTYFVDRDGHNIFQLAVLHRQEKVFSLIYKMGLGKDWAAASFRDTSGNNILHLAGKLVPSSRVSGAALQMQRELQWYKAVENFVHPSLREERNNEKLTPREVFTKEHAELVKAGQEWIKNAAPSCSVVAALIITVAFAAAITVPGGNDSQGNPNYLKKMSFSIFAISNALALCFSSASVLMFLGILTSRYSEEDFLFSLPRKIIIGLLTLFLSIAAMMIAFGETLHLLVFNQHKWNNSPLVLLACLPVTLFGLLQIRLLVEMLRSTYGPSFIQPPK